VNLDKSQTYPNMHLSFFRWLMLLRSGAGDVFNDTSIHELGLTWPHAADADTVVNPSVLCRGKGVFATVNFTPKTILLEYTGLIATRGTTGVYRTEYQMHTSTGQYIDARFSDCKAKYINHATKHANTVIREMYACSPPRVFVVSCKAIKAGDELFYNYGQEYWLDREAPVLQP
jgi:hypothetical protein